MVVDAFGEKVGSEQIGLYNEQQVRGFSLQESGNYRIDGAYFIRSANIVDPALDGVTTTSEGEEPRRRVVVRPA